MNLIEQWIALFFDRLPYTEEAAEARGKIERALQNTAPDAAPDDWKGSSRNIFQFSLLSEGENRHDLCYCKAGLRCG